MRRRLAQGVYGTHHEAAIRTWLRDHGRALERRGTGRPRRSRLMLWAAIAFVAIELLGLLVAALAP